MKSISVEIPLDEALSFLGSTENAIKYLEQNCRKDSDFYLGTGVMTSVKDRVYNSILNQATHKEIESVGR